jgi:hypothetical protein
MMGAGAAAGAGHAAMSAAAHYHVHMLHRAHQPSAGGAGAGHAGNGSVTAHHMHTMHGAHHVVHHGTPCDSSDGPYPCMCFLFVTYHVIAICFLALQDSHSKLFLAGLLMIVLPYGLLAMCFGGFVTNVLYSKYRDSAKEKEVAMSKKGEDTPPPSPQVESPQADQV